MATNTQNAIRTRYKVSRLKSLYDTTPQEYPLEVIIKEIQRGNTTLENLDDRATHRTVAQVTDYARAMLHKHGNNAAYDLLKKELPQFVPAGVLTSRSGMASFSSLVCLEYDDIDDAAYALSVLAQSPHVLCAFRSLHGERLKALIPIDPVSSENTPLTSKTYRHAWYTVSSLFEYVGDADPAAMKPTQTQAMCYDPNVYINWDAVPVAWDIDEAALEEAHPNQIAPENVAYAELSAEYHVAIEDMQWKDDGWGRTRVPCPWGAHENDGWEMRSNGTRIRKNGENDFTIECFKCPPNKNKKRYSEFSKTSQKSFADLRGIDPITTLPDDHPSIVNAPPYEDIYTKRRASVRLSHVAHYIPESVPLETVRKLNNDGVNAWLERTNLDLPSYKDLVLPILKRMMGKKRIVQRNKNHGNSTGWWDHWAKMRQFVRMSMASKRHMLVMTGSAGGGKSTAVLEHLETFADISPTTAQADEKYADALDKGENAMRHRSRNYNREVADKYTPETVPLGLDAEMEEVPCVSPDIPNALAQMGGNPVKEYCKPHCPRFEECTSYAYLSQWRIFKNFDEIYLSYQDDIFSDPLYAPYIKKMQSKKKDFVLCLDESDPASLPPKRGYTTQNLKESAICYKSLDAGRFLDALLENTSKATTKPDYAAGVAAWVAGVQKVIEKYDDELLDAIDREMQGIPVSVEFEKVVPEYDLLGQAMYNTLAHITYKDKTKTAVVLQEEVHPSVYEALASGDCPYVASHIIPIGGWHPGESYTRILWLETFCRLGFGSLGSVDDVLKLPYRYRNFSADLRAFLDTVDSDTPAVKEERGRIVTDNQSKEVNIGWTYYLRPDMNARRGILISASGGYDEIKELYAHSDISITHLTTPAPAWRESNKFYQISTGRYTAKSMLFVVDKANLDTVVDITDRCREILRIIHTEVSRNPLRTLIVAPKALTAEGELAGIPEVQALLALDHVEIINHWHAEGTNRFIGVQNLFIFHYEPAVDEIPSLATRIHRRETLSFEREIIDLEKNGVVLRKVNRYVDPRVQAIFDRECERRIGQAIARGRQMLENIVDCNTYLFTAEPITGIPVKPVFFELDDMQQCLAEHGTLRQLEQYLTDKAELSAAELAEKEGVSERTGYRRRQDSGKQTKAEEDAGMLQRILAYKAENPKFGERKIAKGLGFSYGKVRALLKTVDEVH